MDEFHAGGAGAVEQDPGDERARAHGQVGAAHDRVQVRAGRGQPPAVVHVAVERREALLPVAVDVVGEVVAGLLGRLEEGLEQRARRRPALQDQRALVAAPPPAAGQAGLHLLEVRQAVRVVPGRHARVGGPALVVQRVAALEDHPVDAARAAENLPAGVVDLAPVHERLGLRLVLPVVEPVPDRVGQRGGHVDEHVPRVIRPARLEHEHAVRRVGAEPVRERAARRAAADDDVVVVLCAHDCLLLLSPTEHPGKARPQGPPGGPPR